MRQKIWVIDDSEQPESTDIPDRIQDWNSDSRSPRPSKPINPALAFSLSMIVWGAGHLYLRAYRSGSVFLAAMLFFYLPLSSLWFYRPSIARLAADTGIQAVVLVTGFLIYLALGIICWLGNAVDAYYRATSLRPSKFRGVDNEYLPLFCSLVFPGWGQFLNGQPKKGLFFFLSGGAGVLSAYTLAAAPLAWPAIKARPGSQPIELCLVAAMVLIALSGLLWIVGVHDSFVSCKELFLHKLRRYPADTPVSKRRILKRFFPRLNAVLALLLAISLGHQLVPEGYYLHSLQKLRSEALNQEMEIIPALMDQTIGFFRR